MKLGERECDFSGWMFKKGKRFKNWRQRWFELTGDRLEYYEIENGEKPIYTIILSKGSKLQVSHDEDAPHDNTFQLQTQDRDWLFSIETRKARDAWMTQISNNLPKHASRSIVSSTAVAFNEDSLVEGYLEKTGKWNKAWRRRWCKLIPMQKELLYYEYLDTKKTFKDKIDLNKVTVISEVKTNKHPHGFVLITPGRRYRFAAESAQELHRWFQAISPCVGGKQEKSLREKQGLLEILLQINRFPMRKSDLGNVPLPDWLWHEVVDLMGNIEQEHKNEEGMIYRPGLVVHLMQDTTTLSKEAAMKLLEDTRQSFLSKPLLVDIQGPVYVIGELNGDFDGLVNIFETLGTPPETKYLFLGNIIGTRPQGLGVALLLFALKVYYPEHLYIIRGKMEDQIQSRADRGTLYDECLKQFNLSDGREVWKEFVWLFDHMPICAVVNNTFFAVSSGLSQNIIKVNALRRGKIRPLYIARTNAKKYKEGRLIGSVIVRDYLYNIPSEEVKSYKETSKETDRGLVLYYFGKDMLINFLKVNKFTAMIRSGPINDSEDVYRMGYSTFAEEKLISLCSSANSNAAMMKNKSVKGAVMYLDGEGEHFTFHTFKPDSL